MGRFISPLRYPGGKSQLSKYILSIVEKNNLIGGTYVEPYAGGSGVALFLLINNHVEDIFINDYDYSIYAFWYSILHRTDEFINKIREAPVDIDNWRIQKNIQLNQEEHDIFEIGFSTFFLNRCNRSGILKAGPIGGQSQESDYKIDCRFNKEALIERIEAIAERRADIHISNLDAIEFLTQNQNIFDESTLVNLDPPYYHKGQQLYINFYQHEDHVRLKNFMFNDMDCNWIITYDNTSEIKEIYRDFQKKEIAVRYSAHKKIKASELLIHSPSVILP